jgi:hypothetical protein
LRRRAASGGGFSWAVALSIPGYIGRSAHRVQSNTR